MVKTELLLTEENARFVAEHDDAMAIINEMMTEFLAGFKQPPEELLSNLPRSLGSKVELTGKRSTSGLKVTSVMEE